MRAHINLTGKSTIIPYDHQHLLTGCIHKWIGKNLEHDEMSLYSFSRITGLKPKAGGLAFDGEAHFFFSAFDSGLVKRLVNGIQSDTNLFGGLQVNQLVLQEDPDFTGREFFQIASPVFVKRFQGDALEHILYNDPKAGACLTETLQHKMEIAGIADKAVSVAFFSAYPKAGTKLVTYKGIANRASWCPVIINGSPEAKVLAWNAGVGNSTGIGFGALL